MMFGLCPCGWYYIGIRIHDSLIDFRIHVRAIIRTLTATAPSLPGPASSTRRFAV